MSEHITGDIVASVDRGRARAARAARPENEAPFEAAFADTPQRRPQAPSPDGSGSVATAPQAAADDDTRDSSALESTRPQGDAVQAPELPVRAAASGSAAEPSPEPGRAAATAAPAEPATSGAPAPRDAATGRDGATRLVLASPPQGAETAHTTATPAPGTAPPAGEAATAHARGARGGTIAEPGRAADGPAAAAAVSRSADDTGARAEAPRAGRDDTAAPAAQRLRVDAARPAANEFTAGSRELGGPASTVPQTPGAAVAAPPKAAAIPEASERAMRSRGAQQIARPDGTAATDPPDIRTAVSAIPTPGAAAPFRGAGHATPQDAAARQAGAERSQDVDTARPAPPQRADSVAGEARSAADPAGPRGDASPTMRGEPTARAIAPQITPVMSRGGERPVEIALSPEELGRVRLVLAGTQETGLTVSVQAEREETLELMRRHAGELAREFEALGYSSVAFDFGGESRSGAATHGQGPAPDDAATTPATDDAPRRQAVPGGLDLRL